MLVVLPVPFTQCAAVSTIVGLYSAPPQPIDSRTMNGNSPCVARVPPTTDGLTTPSPGAAAAAGDEFTIAPIAATVSAAAAPPRIVRHFAIRFLLGRGAPGRAHCCTVAESVGIHGRI